ncbi:hypothetical protein IFM89_010078 [Coptis chinensis]|uniref:FAR1 domain-containing protein n=1 Tax=Coptis chinensis TaxID=261450 RepID=A0A835I3S2_9MAGN|nr:hypothetical protein IFM89_010078 [Coptis chinensis]
MDNEPLCFDLNRYHEDVEGDAIEDVEFQRENERDENDEVTQETLNKPEVRMTFDTIDAILEYYRKYGNEKRFPVKIRSSRKDDNGVTRYITLTCCREGKARSRALYDSVLFGAVFGLLSMAAALALALAIPATVVTWITVLVLLAFVSKPRRALVLEGRKITKDIVGFVIKIVIKEGNIVAAVCVVIGYFVLTGRKSRDD